MKTFLSILALLLAAQFAHASDDSAPVEVEISNLCPDRSADQFVYHLKERIRASKGLRLTSAKTTHINIIINGLSVSAGVVYISETWVEKIPGVNFQPYVAGSIAIVSAYNMDSAIDNALTITEKQGSALRAYWNDPANQVKP